MANIMLGAPDLNFTNAQKAKEDNGGPGSSLSNASSYVSVTAMRNRLTAISASYYTTARLDSLTINDMVYALRCHDDATTISPHLSNTTP